MVDARAGNRGAAGGAPRRRGGGGWRQRGACGACGASIAFDGSAAPSDTSRRNSSAFSRRASRRSACRRCACTRCWPKRPQRWRGSRAQGAGTRLRRTGACRLSRRRDALGPQPAPTSDNEAHRALASTAASAAAGGAVLFSSTRLKRGVLLLCNCRIDRRPPPTPAIFQGRFPRPFQRRRRAAHGRMTAPCALFLAAVVSTARRGSV